MRACMTQFTAAMERKLTEKDRQHPYGWETSTLDYLLLRLIAEAGELGVFVLHEDQPGIMDEAVDVANFAMMIYDNASRGATK